FDSISTNLAKRYDYFGHDTGATPDVYVHDLKTRKTWLISVNLRGKSGNDGSADPSISADGRMVAFDSDATKLVTSDKNHTPDVLVRNWKKGTTELVSVNPQGHPGNAASL